jgi:hypothetical protein
MLGADRGLCFFSGYYKHPNAITVDPNPFAKAEISNLSSDFKREVFSFVLYMNNFSPNHQSVYQNSKNMVRPGGYFIAYLDNGNEQFFNEIKRDIGTAFIIMFSKYDPVNRHMIVVGKKNY